MDFYKISWKGHIGNKSVLRYYSFMKSRQFHFLGVINKNAHVNVIYLSQGDRLYIVWRGLLYILLKFPTPNKEGGK